MSYKPEFNLNNTVMSALGVSITELNPEQVVVTMPITGKTRNPLGILHGGVSVMLAETAASAGSYLFIDSEKQTAVGLEINANHIKSVATGTLKAIGKPVHIGKKTMVWDVRIYDDKEDLICISRCTTAILDGQRSGESLQTK